MHNKIILSSSIVKSSLLCNIDSNMLRATEKSIHLLRIYRVHIKLVSNFEIRIIALSHAGSKKRNYDDAERKIILYSSMTPCTLFPFRTPKHLTAPYFSWKVCWTHESIPGREVDILSSGSPVQLESQYSDNLDPSPSLMPIFRYLAQMLETPDQSLIFVHCPHLSNPSLQQFHVGLHQHAALHF